MDLMDPLDLVKRLSTNQLFTDLPIPQWITTTQENNLGTKEKLLKLIITANELRLRLIRIKLPTVMGQIDRLQNDYLDLIKKALSEKESLEGNTTQKFLPTITHCDPLDMVLQYLTGINETRRGVRISVSITNTL